MSLSHEILDIIQQSLSSSFGNIGKREYLGQMIDDSTELLFKQTLMLSEIFLRSLIYLGHHDIKSDSLLRQSIHKFQIDLLR